MARDEQRHDDEDVDAIEERAFRPDDDDDDDDGVRATLARDDEEDDDVDDGPRRVSRRDRIVPRDLKDDGFRGLRRTVYYGVFAVLSVIIVSVIFGGTFGHGGSSATAPIAAHADAAPEGAPATPAPTPTRVLNETAFESPSPTPMPSATPTAASTSSDGDAKQRPAGTMPAFRPDDALARERDAARHASSKMALEAATQIADTDPQAAQQLASKLDQALSGRVAASAAGATPGAAANAPASTGQPAGVPSSAQGASAATGAFVSTRPPSFVDASTLRNDTHEAFVDRESKNAGDVGYQPASASEYELCFGTVLWAELYTDVNSDLPGAVRGMVTRPVYDCATHSVVLVPVGSWVDGFYDSRVVFGESRVVAGFTRIVFPGGKWKFVMGPQIGTDPAGASGLPASVDTHSGRAYRSAFALGILGGLASFLTPQTSVFAAPSITSQLLSSVGTQYANATTSTVNQQIAQPPTLKLTHGYLFPILITRDLAMKPWME